MYDKKSIEDIDVKGKRVLARCDFNVPLKGKEITNDKRIVESLPTIKYLISKGAKLILCSHLGRPKGVFNEEFSLKPVAERLSSLLGKNIVLAEDVVGESAKKAVNQLAEGDVMLLENVRFHKEEEKNDPEFSKKLASLADIYVNDAFGTAHRAHSSTAGVADYLPAVCGYLIQKEISVMGKALAEPVRPFVAILGGVKVSDKIGVINNLIEKVDTLIIGGAMSYTFAKALGGTVGKSPCETDKLDLARELYDKANKKGIKFLLPIDTRCGDKFAEDAEITICETKNIRDDLEGLDIGPKTEELFSNAITGAKTVIWNGPMGVAEWERFSSGTRTIAKAIAATGAISIIGGGDSVAAVEKLGFADKMTHISTGGGASLEFLEGIELPGIACLNNK